LNHREIAQFAGKSKTGIVRNYLGRNRTRRPKGVREVRTKQPNKDSSQEVESIADELSKLAKLKEQGVITEDEFSRMKNNLTGEK
jgi:hypothetical protein